MHAAGPLRARRQAGLDRDVELGRRAALAHLIDMDLAGAVGDLASRLAHVHDLVSTASVCARSGTPIVIGPRPRI